MSWWGSENPFEKTSDHLAGTAGAIEETMTKLNGALGELSKTLQAIQNLPIVKGKVKKLDENEDAAGSP